MMSILFKTGDPTGARILQLSLLRMDEATSHTDARQLQGAHVTKYDRLWSTLPVIRPIATIIEDTLADYGTDKHSANARSYERN